MFSTRIKTYPSWWFCGRSLLVSKSDLLSQAAYFFVQVVRSSLLVSGLSPYLLSSNCVCTYVFMCINEDDSHANNTYTLPIFLPTPNGSVNILLSLFCGTMSMSQIQVTPSVSVCRPRQQQIKPALPSGSTCVPATSFLESQTWP